MSLKHVRLLSLGAALAAICVLAGCGRSEPSGAQSSGPGYGQPKKEFDPILVNGPVFEGWEAPKWALVITGEQHGYLEPCGCAGLENQKGGLRRRYTFLKDLEARGWPLVKVDVGGLIRRYGRQAELKFQTAVEALRQMEYHAVGFGKEDLRLPTGELFVVAASADESNPSPFVSANVGLFEFGTPKPFEITEIAGVRVAVTAILGEEIYKEINNPEILYRTPSEALAEIMPQLEAESDVQILLSYASPEESRRLAEEFPALDVVVTAGGADEPPNEARTAGDAKTPVIEVGHKGMYAVVLGMYDDEATPMRYQRVPLDSRYANSPEMDQLMVSYQDQLRSLGWQGLDLNPVSHPRASAANPALGEFVGAKRCGECHKTAYSIWEKTGHAHATETLTKLEPPRQFDPECISCHSTGWNPQEYFPYEHGFVSLEETPHLAGNSCENCHGPGGAHVAAELGRDLTERNTQRATMRLTRATAEDQTCRKCHDLDNSPEFNFDRYWPKVEHKGTK